MTERMRKIPEMEMRTHRVDIADQDGIEWIMREYSPDTVIHLASFPRQKVINANPQLGSRAMSEGLLNLLECSTRYSVGKFVYISSSMVYGDFTDDIREDAVCRPQGQYGIMKLAGEWLTRDYTRKTGMAHVVIRPSAVYGPYDVEDRVISKFLLTAKRGGTIKVNGATETLDFTYVDDAADGIVSAALKDTANNNTYNITKSHSHTLLAAAELAVKIVGKGRIEVRERDQDFPSRGALNIDAARRDLAFDPKVDIEQGFHIYADWINHSKFWQNK
jgi:nucleoside-diphosphate-sugar epimerase